MGPKILSISVSKSKVKLGDKVTIRVERHPISAHEYETYHIHKTKLEIFDTYGNLSFKKEWESDVHPFSVTLDWYPEREGSYILKLSDYVSNLKVGETLTTLDVSSEDKEFEEFLWEDEEIGFLLLEILDLPEKLIIPKEGYSIYELKVRVKNLGGLKLYNPSLSLKISSSFDYIKPEWMNVLYLDGWFMRDHGNPPDPNLWIYYYRFEDMDPKSTHIHNIRLLISSRGKEGLHPLALSAGAYLDNKSWIWTGWVEFNLNLVKDFK
ncbi:hypothetical protein HRbin06_00341 [archaeon HR06]|nr:hypothetical protein HRbin06_00341 [archaeon HR06]